MENKEPLSPHIQIYRWHISSLVSITLRITGIINILSITLIILSIITFHEIIIKKLFISTLEKATEKAISIDNININFNKSLFTLHNIKIYNSGDFENEFFFSSKKP